MSSSSRQRLLGRLSVAGRLRPGAIIANASWLAVARAGGDVLSFLVFLAIARRFGPEGSGAYSYAFAIAGLAAAVANPALSDLGIRNYVRSQRGAERARLFDTLLATQFGLGLVAVAGLAVFLLLSAPGPATAIAVASLSVYLIGFAVGQTLFVPSFAAEAMRTPALAELGCRTLAVAAALATLLFTDWDLSWVVAGFSLAGLIYLWPAMHVARAHWHPGSRHADPAALIALAREGWPVAAAELVLMLYLRIDLILLALLAGEAAAGVYAAGLKFVEVGVMPILFLTLAALPRLSLLFAARSSAEAGRLADALLAALLFLGGLLALALLFIVPPLLAPVLGQRFEGAAHIMPWMAAIAVLLSYEFVLVRVLLATNRQLAYLRALVVSTLVKAGTCLALVPPLGPTGAALSALLALAVLTAGCACAVSPSWPIANQVRVLAKFVAALTASIALGSFLTQPAAAPLLAAVTAPLLFAALAWRLKLLSHAEMAVLLGAAPAAQTST